MIVLPRTLPPDIRMLFAKQLEDLPLEAVAERICGVVLRLFNARDVVLMLARKDSVTKLSRADTSVNDRSPAALEDFRTQWMAKVDRELIHTLTTKISPSSYSPFSWPFASIKSVDPKLAVPREFTLILPISSDLCVISERDSGFLGYFVLFFDSMQQFSSDTVRLLTTLPPVLSEVMLAYLRRENKSPATDLSEFAHDMKRNLLLVESQLEQLRSHSFEAAPQIPASIERILQRMIQQTSTILLADKVDSDRLKLSPLKLDLNEITREVADSFRNHFSKAGLELKMELEEPLPHVSLDPAIFPSVIENLLDNSLKYSDRGGSVVLSSRLQADGQVCLEISDRGQPIADDECERIFLKHYRGASCEAPGSGLGLYLVRKIVEAHYGRVYLQKNSELNRFIIELPVLSQISGDAQ